MSTVIIILIILGYLVNSLILFVVSALGIVNTKNTTTLSIALAFFVLPPLALLWAKVVVPILTLTLLGYVIILGGKITRTQLFKWRDTILKEMKNNLTKSAVEE